MTTKTETIFVNRRRELSQLSNELKIVEDSLSGRMVLVTGKPGVGKSALVDTFLNQVDQKSVRVLRSSGSSTATSPYMALSDLLMPVAKSQSGHTRQILNIIRNISNIIPAGTLPPEASTALSAISGIAGSFSGISQADMKILSSAQYVKELFLSFFQKISEQKPVVVFFDDVQLFDASSLEIVGFLVKNMPSYRALLILGIRKGYVSLEVETKNLALLENIIQKLSNPPTAINLESLDSKASQEMIDRLVGNDALDQDQVNLLVKKSEGDPFYISKVVKELLVQRKGDGRSDGGLSIDKIISMNGVSPILESSLSRISKENLKARKILDFAAVLGEEFDIRVLSELMKEDPLDLLHLLSDLENTYGIVNASAEYVGRYSFDHSITRQVLLSKITPLLFDLNSRAAKAYEKLGHQPQLVAVHYDTANEFELASKFYKLAAQVASESLAYADAIRYLERCLVLIANGKLSRTAFERLTTELELAQYKFSNGNFEDSYDKSESILQSKELTDVQAAKASLIAGKSSRYIGTKLAGTQGILYLKRAAAIYEKLNEKQSLAEIYSALATVLDHFAHHDSAEKYFGKSQVLYNETNDLLGLAVLERKSGMIYDSRRVIGYLKQAKDTFLKTGATIEVARCLSNLGAEQCYIADFQSATSSLNQSIEAYRKIDSYEIDAPLNNLGIVQTQLKDYASAERSLTEARERANEDFNLLCTTMNLSNLDLLRGAVNQGFARLLEVQPKIDQSGEPLIQDYYAYNLTSFLVRQDKLEEALEWLNKYPVNEWKRDKNLAIAKRQRMNSHILKMQGKNTEAERLERESREAFSTKRPQKWFYELDYYPADIHLLD